MKTINVDEKTRIALFDDNVVIQKMRLNKKTNEIEWVSRSYFRDLADCATDLLETLPARSSELTEDLNSIVLAVKEAETKIINALTK